MGATTLWEEGRQDGRRVALSAAAAAFAMVGIDLALTERVGFFFDLAFVTICVAAAFSVHPRDFFVVGVLPPLLMLCTVLTLAITTRGDVAEPGDGLVQAVVSGLANRAGALVLGYSLTLVVIALRQVVAKNGTLRRTSTQQRRRPVSVS